MNVPGRRASSGHRGCKLTKTATRPSGMSPAAARWLETSNTFTITYRDRKTGAEVIALRLGSFQLSCRFADEIASEVDGVMVYRTAGMIRMYSPKARKGTR